MPKSNPSKEKEGNAELLMVNFDLRSKVFINRIIKEESFLENKSEVPNQIEDRLFADLFTMTSSELLSQENITEMDKHEVSGNRLGALVGSGQGNMQLYTSKKLGSCGARTHMSRKQQYNGQTPRQLGQATLLQWHYSI